MKKILCGMLAGLIVMGSLPSLATAQAKETNNLADTRNIAYRLYVSTSGNDTSGDGSQGSPFATLGKAKEKVRTLDKSSGDIVVEIADGFYSLDDTLVFGQEDSGSENCMIYYEAADGAELVISGGDRLEGTWELEGQGKNIWKIPLERDHKLRALYVNGERSYMASTETTIAAQGSWGTYTVDGQEDWAWNTGSKFDGILYNKTDLPEITRNPEDVEIENVLAWNKNTVGIREIADDGSGHWILKLRQPYGAIAQTPGWGVGIKGSGDFSINNAYELLDQPGEFYFDKTEQMLYYIPRSGEDLETAEVVAPPAGNHCGFRGFSCGFGRHVYRGPQGYFWTGGIYHHEGPDLRPF